MKQFLHEGEINFTVLNGMSGNEAILKIKVGPIHLSFTLNKDQIDEFIKKLTDREYSPNNSFHIPMSVHSFVLSADKPRKYISLTKEHLKKD